MMDKAIAISIFASYFLLIFCLFGVILKAFVRTTSRWVSASKISLFTALTLASFGHTWFCRLRLFRYVQLTEHAQTCLNLCRQVFINIHRCPDHRHNIIGTVEFLGFRTYDSAYRSIFLAGPYFILARGHQAF